MKIKNFIGGILATLAFFFLVGSVGALECDNVTCLQCLVQCGISMLVGWAGLAMCGNGLE